MALKSYTSIKYIFISTILIKKINSISAVKYFYNSYVIRASSQVLVVIMDENSKRFELACTLLILSKEIIKEFNM